MKVEIEIVIENKSNDEDDTRDFLIKFEKNIISKVENKYCAGFWNYTITGEFEFNSMRDFIFDFEKRIKDFEEILPYNFNIKTVKIKSIEYNWKAFKYGWSE